MDRKQHLYSNYSGKFCFRIFFKGIVEHFDTRRYLIKIFYILPNMLSESKRKHLYKHYNQKISITKSTSRKI